MARRSSRRRSSSAKTKRPATKRHYPRTARLNALLREIVADYVERIDDNRLGFLTVTGVEVDADLNVAEVFISVLDAPVDEASDQELLGVLGEYRKAVQGEIARSARLRKTPEVQFAFDPAVRTGARIEDILATLADTSDDGGEPSAEQVAEDPTDSPDDDPGPGTEARTSGGEER
jgi:ribosome-binding factor A